MKVINSSEIIRENEERNSIKELIITRGAIEKIRTYSRLVCELFNNQPLECYGFLLNPKKINNLTVYDAMLAAGQKVSGVEVIVKPEMVFQSKAEIENSPYDAVGCWHSHHNMGAFASSTDDHNLENLVNSFNTREFLIRRAPSQMFSRTEKGWIIPAGEVIYEINSPAAKFVTVYPPSENHIDNLSIKVDDNKNVIISIATPRGLVVLNAEKNPYTIFKADADSERLAATSFTYSMTVSNDAAYIELARKKRCNVCEHYELKREKVGLKIIDVSHDVVFEEKDLVKEIKEDNKGLVVQRNYTEIR